MGNLCKKNLINNNNITTLEDDGRLKKILNQKEIEIWTILSQLNLTQISQIKNQAIYFNFSDLIYENFISLGSLMNNLILNENFFLFNDLFEIILGLIDFVQIIIHLKKKYGLEYFFLVNFNKFSLMRELNKNKNLFTKLVYLDHKLIDHYNSPEIVVKEDTNLFSSFSFVNGPQVYKSLIASSKQNTNLSSNKTGNSTNLNSLYDNANYNPNNNAEDFGDIGGDNIDMNSYFYSKCNDKYRKLRQNFSLEKCEHFYSDCFITFLMKFLIKKTIICDSILLHDFQNFKNKLKNTLSYFLKNYDYKISLQKLKEILTNFYINSNEYNLFKDKCDRLLNNRDVGNIALFDKIVIHENLCIQFMYGDCDVSSELSKHNLSYIYDYNFKLEENSIFKIMNVKSAKKASDERDLSTIGNLEDDRNGKNVFDNKDNNECKNSYKQKKIFENFGNHSYSSNYLSKNNLNNSELESLNKIIIHKNFIKNKSSTPDKSIICINCSKKLILNELPSEASQKINLNDYNQDYLETKYPNFALEYVLNYFCYFFSVENIKGFLDAYKANNKTTKTHESLSRLINASNESSIRESNMIDQYDVFNNRIYFKENKFFYVYKKGENSIIFVYYNQKSKTSHVLNMDEITNIKDKKKTSNFFN